MILLVLVPLARVIEALRDAIDFNLGVAPMNLAWHILKVPQYGLWFGSGLAFAAVDNMKVRLAMFLISLLLAYPAFEFSLRFFRKRVLQG